MNKSIEELSREAARKWFAEARELLETNRERTGDNFADAGQSSFEFATNKLASIIASVFTESETLEQVIADGGFSTIARERVRMDRERERTQPLPTGEREKERLQQIREIADLGSARDLDDAYDRLEAIVRIAG